MIQSRRKGKKKNGNNFNKTLRFDLANSMTTFMRSANIKSSAAVIHYKSLDEKFIGCLKMKSLRIYRRLEPS